MNLKGFIIGLIYLIEWGLVYVLSKNLYGGVFDLNIFGTIGLIIGIINFFLWSVFKKNDWMVWFPIIQCILILVLPVTFWFSKPEYTFQQAESIIKAEKSFLNEYKLLEGTPENILMLDSPNFLIPKAYLIKAKNENGVEAFIYFDPIRKNYRFIEKTTSNPIIF